MTSLSLIIILSGLISSSFVGNVFGKLTGNVVQEGDLSQDTIFIVMVDHIEREIRECPAGYTLTGSFIQDSCYWPEGQLQTVCDREVSPTAIDYFGYRSPRSWVGVCTKNPDTTFLLAAYDDYSGEATGRTCENFGSTEVATFKVDNSVFGANGIDGKDNSIQLKSGWMRFCSEDTLLVRSVEHNLEEYDSCENYGYEKVAEFKPDKVPYVSTGESFSGIDSFGSTIWNGWFQVCSVGTTDDQLEPIDGLDNILINSFNDETGVAYSCPEGYSSAGSFKPDSSSTEQFVGLDSYGNTLDTSGWMTLCTKMPEENFLMVVYDDYNPDAYSSETAAVICEQQGLSSATFFKIDSQPAEGGYAARDNFGTEIKSGWMTLCTNWDNSDRLVTLRSIENNVENSTNSCESQGYLSLGKFKPDFAEFDINSPSAADSFDNYVWNGFLELCFASNFVEPECSLDSDCSTSFMCSESGVCVVSEKCPAVQGVSVTGLSPGTRVLVNGQLNYCDSLSLSYLETKSTGVSCTENYECASNTCLDSVCVSVTSILQEQNTVLNQIWCAIQHPVDFFDRTNSGQNVANNEYLACLGG